MGIIINGKRFVGKNVSIKNGEIVVDGVNVTPNEKTINIEVAGNIETLKVDSCDKIIVTGDVTNLQNGSGDITCKNISGSTTSGSGNIEVEGYIGGNVQTGSGDVNCKGYINGNVKTGSGDIKYTKGSSMLKD